MLFIVTTNGPMIVLSIVTNQLTNDIHCNIPTNQWYSLLHVGQVASHMRLRGGVEFTDEIPRTASGKILRRKLREKAKILVK